MLPVMSYITKNCILLDRLKAATSNINECKDVITDSSEVLPAFCQSLEAVLRQGLKRGLAVIGLADRDYWNCIEGLTKSPKVYVPVSLSVAHVISVVQQCETAQTSQCRGRLFLRIALTKGVLSQALQCLLENEDYVRYWYKDFSVLVDYREKGVLLEILKTLKKKTYKLNVNNCSFLNETWLIPETQQFEFVPCSLLGLTLFALDGKCIIVNVQPGSIADDKGIQAGDCLDELFGQLIDERWSVKIGELKRKYKGKPITATIVKGHYSDGRWFTPIFQRFRALCESGKCAMTLLNDKTENRIATDQEEVKLRHIFNIVYLGASDIGKKGSCVYVQDGIKKLYESKQLENKPVKLQLMERDITVNCAETGEIIGRYSYTETSSCALRDDEPCQFGFVTGNTTCSFADNFKCHVFSCESTFMARQIIEGIGHGFDRTIYCV